MTVIPRIADLQPAIQVWRRDLHAHPELMYDVHRTAAFVAAQLTAFGCDEVVTGIGRTGVVGVIRGKGTGTANGGPRVIGMRADMDALPIEEQTNLAYASKVPGKMHACGHDGHTAMLLGAAQYMAETRNFSGTVVVIFQPAEEGGAGGAAMIEDGLFDRFGIEQVYGMHNGPALAVGQFALCPGALMASMDRLGFQIEGVGGHAAYPHNTVDPILAGAQLITALQSIVSRSVNPLDSAVISICEFHAGHATNVIPASAALRGTIRSLNPAVRDLLEARIKAVAAGVALQTGTSITVNYERGYPVLINDAQATETAARVAAQVSTVDANMTPIMAAEDFAYMLEQRPGAYIFIGNGDSAGLHHPAYDFNDSALAYGASFWARLAEDLMPA